MSDEERSQEFRVERTKNYTIFTPKEENIEVDRLSKQVGYEDWFITKDFVKMFTNKRGEISVDRFASYVNKKILKM